MYTGKTLQSILSIHGIANVNVQRPSACPRCKHAIGFDVLHAGHFNIVNGHRIFALLQCSNCLQPFVCLYNEVIYGGNTSYELFDVGPSRIEPRTFDKEIEQLSKRFVSIYNQAFAAEQQGLDEVCGMAYGKALEFLLKDFAISQHPENEKEISAMLLGMCIQTHVDDIRIKTAASRCAWLRNDQTHYLVKHEDKDLQDMKKLLEAVIHWVGIALVTADAELIQPKNPS
jgi:hypothetical protein